MGNLNEIKTGDYNWNTIQSWVDPDDDLRKYLLD